MAQNSYGAWQGTTIAPQTYQPGPTASMLPPFSQAGGVINPGPPLTPPPSLTGLLEQSKILPPDNGKKKKKNQAPRDRLTEAIMANDPNLNYLNWTTYNTNVPGTG